MSPSRMAVAHSENFGWDHPRDPMVGMGMCGGDTMTPREIGMSPISHHRMLGQRLLSSVIREIAEDDDMRAIEHYLVDTCGMSPEEANEATTGYIQYIVAELAKEKKHGALSPTIVIDQAWHAHVLHTRRYEAFCNKYFGRFVHHNPEAGFETVTPQLEVTRKLVAEIFVTPSSTWEEEAVMCNNCGGYGVAPDLD